MQKTAIHKRFTTIAELLFHPGVICVNRRSSAVKIGLVFPLQVLKK